MSRLFVLTNHSVTSEQHDDAVANLHVAEIVELPRELKANFGEVPPEVNSVADFVRPYIEWLESQLADGDVVWVQGEWGVTASVMGWCRVCGVRCVYATTRREAEEIRMLDGKVNLVHVFKHVRFRDFPRF